MFALNWNQQGLLPLSASGNSSHLLFPCSGEGKPCTGPWTPACSALPWAAQHTPWAGRGAHSGSKASAAGSQLCSLGTSTPWQEEGPATRVSQGQFLRCKWSRPNDPLLLFLLSLCPHFPLLPPVFDDAVPHPGCDLVSRCHVPI